MALEEEQLQDGSSAPSGEWLTVSQAAALLQVSERTIRRRCESGKISGRLASLETGRAWLIDGQRLPKGLGLTTSGQAAATTADGADTSGHGADVLRPQKGPEVSQAAATVRPPLNPPSTPSAKLTDDMGASGEARGGEDGERDTLLAHLQGEVEFLRARNAELNAVVMQQARALASSTQERPVLEIQAAPESEIKPSRGPVETARPPMPTAPPTAPKREPRPLWAVILGIRPKP
jgi:excisionase family DNA binding protein